MSKLSDIGDEHVPDQRVLGCVSTSDIKAKKKRGKKGLPPKPAALLRIDSWTVILYRTDGERFFQHVKGDYAAVCARRDQYFATGRYEKAWIIFDSSRVK